MLIDLSIIKFGHFLDLVNFWTHFKPTWTEKYWSDEKTKTTLINGSKSTC